LRLGWSEKVEGKLPFPSSESKALKASPPPTPPPSNKSGAVDKMQKTIQQMKSSTEMMYFTTA
jgi:hypothetical protein